MRVILILFDSLNRAALECFGGTWVRTPNFNRLARRSAAFDNHYAGSLPCMPARRDFHTGRLNFLHRSWGPIEPFDNSFPVLLREGGIYSHLVSDHYHYFEDGGWGYHQRFDTWEFIRGQEADPWQAMVRPQLERFREIYHASQIEEERGGYRLQNYINRQAITREEDFPVVRCVDRSLDFLERHCGEDGWLLQLEAFDPHEPFTAPARFREAYRTSYSGRVLDWPRYLAASLNADEIAELRANYAALVAMCDEQLGRVLDFMDRHDMWRDTAVVLTTDHGLILGEHDWLGKNRMPLYNEIVRLPLLVHDPAHPEADGQRRRALSHATDIMPTILDLFGREMPAEVCGRSLRPLVEADGKGHEAVLFGLFGGATNVTDGRYTYFRYPVSPAQSELYEYTLMPAHARSLFTAEEFAGARLVEPLPFTKGFPVLRLPALRQAKRPPLQGGGFAETNNVIYDLESDPGQSRPIDAPDVEARLIHAMRQVMARHDAPPEAYGRLGLAPL